MPALEYTAHDIETAIKQGLAKLNLLRAEVRIEILDDGSRGVLGIGARPARVRLTPYAEVEAAGLAKPIEIIPPAAPASETFVPPVASSAMAVADQAPPALSETSSAQTIDAQSTDEPVLADAHVQLAVELTQGVLDRMDFRATCSGRIAQPPDGRETASIWVDIQGSDASRLLAHQMEALEALQLIVQTMWAHRTKSGVRLTLDADSYKALREHRMTQMAQRLAERVVSTERSITLEPMSASERRLVHLALRDHPSVTTESQGEGSERRVTIKLKK